MPVSTLLIAAIAAIAGEQPARQDGARVVPISGLGGSLQNPCWSPESDRLVLTQWTGGYNRGKAIVHVVPARGGESLATLSTLDAQSVNAPGSCWRAGRVVYSSDPDEGDQVYAVPPEGGEARVLTQPPEVAWEPTLAPDGQSVVYESHRQGARGEIWRIDAEGRTTRLTSGSNDRQPNWSPRGDLIVFQRHERGQVDIWTMRADGRNLRNVTRTPHLEETDVTWSPSGRYLVFSSDGVDVDFASLFTIRRDGSARRRLTRTRGMYDGAPAWSPDGRRIAFESRAGDPDGSPGTRLFTIAAPSGRR